MKRSMSAWALCALITLSIGAAHAADELWSTDFEAAKATAAKEGKDLLVDFTGSDWCGWCIKLKEEVFDQDAFKKEAVKSFVLVELDYPKQKQLDAKLKAQNDGLAQQYKIQGFPTILLMTAKGEVYGRTGYQAGGPEKYVAHLAELKGGKAKRAELLDKASRAEGLDKAKLLDEYVDLSGKAGAEEGLDAKIEDIIRLDAENKAGLKNKYTIMKRLSDVEKSQTADEALGKLDAILKELAPTGEQKQQILVMKGQIIGQHKGDKAGMIAAFKEARDAAPKSELGGRLDEALKKMEAAPQPPAPPAQK